MKIKAKDCHCGKGKARPVEVKLQKGEIQVKYHCNKCGDTHYEVADK